MKQTAASQPEKLLSFNHLGQCYKPLKKAFALIAKENIKQKQPKPIFLLLGQPESGKNTFISSAEQINSTQEVLLHNKLPKCIVYHCQQANWLRLPGEFLVQLDDQGKRLLCKALKKSLQYFKNEITLSGVAVILDLYDMLTRSKFSNDNRLSQINQLLCALNYIYNKPFTVDFFLNKCDLVPGFIEFFGNRDKEFKEQDWGFSLADISNSALTEEFNILIKKLNNQLIWRLRHETHIENLNTIKEFPIKIEQLKTRLTPLLTEHLGKLQSLANLQLADLHLISCRQFNILESSDNQSALSVKLLKPENHQNNSKQDKQLHKYFFVKNAYQNIINHQKIIVNKNTTTKLAYFSFILLCIAIISGSIIFLSHQLSENIEKSNQISLKLQKISQQFLTQNNSLSSPDNLTSKTKELQTINYLVSELKQQKHSFPGSNLIFYKSNTYLNKANYLRDQFIKTQWLPAFTGCLHDFIEKNLENNPEKTYIALKIYLMLGGEKHNTVNIDYINQHLSQIISENTELSAAQLPKIISQEQLPKLELDHELINKARAYFSNMQAEQLAYVLLFSKIDFSKQINLNQELAIQSPTSILQAKNINTISAIYTGSVFEQVLTFDIPSAAHEATTGNPVLGEIKRNNQGSTEELITKLKSQYINSYTETWETALQQLSFSPSAQPEQLLQQLQLISSTDSPLLKLLQVIKNNTEFQPIEQQSSKIKKLNQLLITSGDKNNNALYNSFIAMRQLGKNIEHIQLSGQAGLDAFNQLQSQLDREKQNNIGLNSLMSASNSLPNPLRLWMINLSNHYYQLLAKKAGQYVNQLWLKQIAKPFHKNFSSSYPFKKDAINEVDILSFNHFFAKNGALDKFESKYILPLLSQGQQGWTVNLNIASTLQIPHEIMQQIQNFAKIQENYFGKTPDSANIEFSAFISTLPKDIKSVIITSKGKTTKLHDSLAQASNFTWPESNSNDKLMIDIISKDNEAKTIEFSGTWAWAKAIDKLSKTSKSKSGKTSNTNKIILSVPSSIKDENVEITLNFEPTNQFNQKLLLKTWMPYWVFKSR